jgi:TonB-dependent SusC/RagA subfamily outer membrane receptor
MKKTLILASLITFLSLSVLAQEETLMLGRKSISLDSFDPNTIESVTILKNQAAIDAYGSDAKDGVIIVESKNSSVKKVINPEPLVIIDGEKYNCKLIVDNVKVSAGSTSINKSDIKTISILKNESATSVFGDAGKNGVIVITTKK